MTEVYTLALVPEQAQLGRLNRLRHKLYSEGYRYSNTLPENDVHITISQLRCTEKQAQALRRDFVHILTNQTSFEIHIKEVTGRITMPSWKFGEKGHGWVAFLFDDPNLKKLSKMFEETLSRLGVSDNEAYASSIKSVDESAHTLIANHMNICNYCRTDRIKEAQRLVMAEAPRALMIDKVILRKEDGGSTIWTVALTSSKPTM